MSKKFTIVVTYSPKGFEARCAGTVSVAKTAWEAIEGLHQWGAIGRCAARLVDDEGSDRHE